MRRKKKDSQPPTETEDLELDVPSGDEGAEASAAEDPLAASEARAHELEDRWLRAKAELENNRRRQRLDLEEARRFGAVPLLGSMLSAFDTLQRAIEEAQKAHADEDPLIQGLKLTEQQFLAALEEHGVTRLECAPGQAFDPAQHRALLEQPTDEQPAGTILSVFQAGYQVHDRLLREAQVVVARAAEPAGDAPAEVSSDEAAEDRDADV